MGCVNCGDLASGPGFDLDLEKDVVDGEAMWSSSCKETVEAEDEVLEGGLKWITYLIAYIYLIVCLMFYTFCVT